MATSSTPLSWNSNVNPNQVPRYSDPDALALYYNTTLTELGKGLFSNVSLLISTFHSVNIPPGVNQTALAANADVADMNTSIPKALSLFGQTRTAISAKEYVNATSFLNEGCENEVLARQSFSDFQAEAVRLTALAPTNDTYAPGEALTNGEVAYLLAQCDLLRDELPQGSARLSISSPQTSVETGGRVFLNGTLSAGGKGVGGQTMLLYLDKDYFGSMAINGTGGFAGPVDIDFVYRPLATLQAVVAPNATIGFAGAQSNLLNFTILFNSTKIVLGDPPAYFPTFGFGLRGDLTTTAGTPLPGATVRLTFVNESELAVTGPGGAFNASFVVPANATDGVHYVYAAFAPRGVFGPSTNFTSIDVVREPLTLDVAAPSLSLSGFVTEVSGRLMANGTAVSGAHVTVNTPWGGASGRTNSAGLFRLSFQVSPFEFLFGAQVLVRAAPSEAYVSSGSAVVDLGLLNPLIVILPLLFLGMITFEAKEVREFRRSAGRRAPETVLVERPTSPQEGPNLTEAGGPPVEGMLAYYRRAISLAGARFGLRFEESMTVREISRDVVGREVSKGAEDFRELMLDVEDFLYSKSFGQDRAEAAGRRLASLEEAWR